VRKLVFAGRARPSGPKLSAHFAFSKVLSCGLGMPWWGRVPLMAESGAGVAPDGMLGGGRHGLVDHLPLGWFEQFAAEILERPRASRVRSNRASRAGAAQHRPHQRKARPLTRSRPITLVRRRVSPKVRSSRLVWRMPASARVATANGPLTRPGWRSGRRPRPGRCVGSGRRPAGLVGSLLHGRMP
jgi:hypothetical protein